MSHRKPSQTNAGVALKSQTTAWGGALSPLRGREGEGLKWKEMDRREEKEGIAL